MEVVNSGLSLIPNKIVAYNMLQLICVPGQRVIEDYEIADNLAKKGSLHPFIGSELSCIMSESVAKWIIRDWRSREHQEYW